MKPNRKQLIVSDRREWRSWLDTNVSQVSHIWLRILKKGSPEPGIYYDEAIEEALCYGWIDGTLNTLDDQSYLLRFSPRKPNSIWAISNIQRVETLIEQGLMREPGLEAIQAGKDSGEWEAALQREDPDYLPVALDAAFDQDPSARKAFQQLPISTRKRYIYWVQSAKRTETVQRRISEILNLIQEAE